MGAAGLVVSAMVALLIKEPKAKIAAMGDKMKDNKAAADAELKKEQDSGKKPGFKDLFTNPVNKWCLIGTFFRNFGGSITTYYLPVFFLKNYPLYKI